MVLIGLLLLAGAAAFGIDLVVLNRDSIDVEGFGQVVSTTPAGMLVAGVVIGLVAAVGIMLMRDGAIRRRRLRAEARESAAERDRMAAMYEEEHAAHRRDHVAVRDGEPVDLRESDRVTTF